MLPLQWEGERKLIASPFLKEVFMILAVAILHMKCAKYVMTGALHRLHNVHISGKAVQVLI